MLGKNEAGKSVLLKCLVGVLRLDGGNVQMSIDCDVESTGGDFDDGAMTAINPKIGFSPQVLRIFCCVQLLVPTESLIRNLISRSYGPTIAELRDDGIDGNTSATELSRCHQRTFQRRNR